MRLFSLPSYRSFCTSLARKCTFSCYRKVRYLFYTEMWYSRKRNLN